MVLTERFQRALLHAANAHACHLRKGTKIPYLSHLLAVASLVLENGGTEDEAIAALLHDAVEDQGGAPRLKLIRAEFGKRVADIVDGCTDTDEDPKPPWEKRKRKYLARLPKQSASVRLVSAADKLHNARCILADHRLKGKKVWKRFNAPQGKILWYYRSLVKTYQKAGRNPLVDELARVVETLEHEVR
jgi:(p)ppGpp synthase/HD superfamily hydrolase